MSLGDDWRKTFRPDIPRPARMYNYFLGGKEHFEADRKAAEQIDHTKLYEPADAIKLAKDTSPTKFDATVEVAMRLGVDRHRKIRSEAAGRHCTNRPARQLDDADPMRIRQIDKGQRAVLGEGEHGGAGQLVVHRHRDVGREERQADGGPGTAGDYLKRVGRAGGGGAPGAEVEGGGRGAVRGARVPPCEGASALIRGPSNTRPGPAGPIPRPPRLGPAWARTPPAPSAPEPPAPADAAGLRLVTGTGPARRRLPP